MATNQQEHEVEEREVEEDFGYQKARDNFSDMRTAALTVAVLMVAATYQAVLSPPGGLWQEDSDSHQAGTSIMGTKYPLGYILFTFWNTLVFCFSIFTIDALTGNFPRKVDLSVAICAFLVIYPTSAFVIVPGGYRTWVLVALIFPIVFFGLYRNYPRFRQKIGCR